MTAACRVIAISLCIVHSYGGNKGTHHYNWSPCQAETHNDTSDEDVETSIGNHWDILGFRAPATEG